VITDYLKAQVEAGAQALQVFDSWAGALGRQDYREFALPHSRQLLSGLANAGVPVVHFGVGTTAILREIAEAGGDVIGVDWRQPLDDAWAAIGPDRGIQGNLDPTLLLGPRDRLLMAADEVLARAARRPGHIFNLGHGILPTTSLEAVQELARHVHMNSQRSNCQRPTWELPTSNCQRPTCRTSNGQTSNGQTSNFQHQNSELEIGS
jgi:uroporphyrinogen decarboxylase